MIVLFNNNLIDSQAPLLLCLACMYKSYLSLSLSIYIQEIHSANFQTHFPSVCFMCPRMKLSLSCYVADRMMIDAW